MPEPVVLEARIIKVFEEKLNFVVPSVDTDLFATGGLDSLSFVGLLVQLEEDFGVKISLEDLELDNFRSVARIAKFIASRVGQSTSAEAEECGALAQANYGRSIEHG